MVKNIAHRGVGLVRVKDIDLTDSETFVQVKNTEISFRFSAVLTNLSVPWPQGVKCKFSLFVQITAKRDDFQMCS